VSPRDVNLRDRPAGSAASRVRFDRRAGVRLVMIGRLPAPSSAPPPALRTCR
jgi:hypothetical protein